MKLISWNVNGLRAVLGKDFESQIQRLDPDILCLQEIKAKPEQVELPLGLSHYQTFWNSAQKPGYSGTAVFSKIPPISVTTGIGMSEHDSEGRVLTVEFQDFYLVNVYTPNSQNELARLPYRQVWDVEFLNYLIRLEQKKHVIFCGDLNVAHREIDLARPKDNRRAAGFTDEERAGFDQFVNHGFIDTFRHFYPDLTGAYTWWSYRGGARQRNVGWRIDYFCASQALKFRLAGAKIHSLELGSDHCPVELILA